MEDGGWDAGIKNEMLVITKNHNANSLYCGILNHNANSLYCGILNNTDDYVYLLRKGAVAWNKNTTRYRINEQIKFYIL